MTAMQSDHGGRLLLAGLGVGLLLSAGAAAAIAQESGTVVPARQTVSADGPRSMTPAPAGTHLLGALPSPTPGGGASDEEADDGLEILIIQALDQPTDLRVEDVPIRQALQQLADNTGIPIRLAPGTTGLLPYGSQTKLSATIEKRPLRESLEALLGPLGLVFEPCKDQMLVQPAPPLRRLARRATWDELDTLQGLHTRPWSDALLDELSFQFLDMPAGDAAENRRAMVRQAAAVGAGSALEVLERVCDQLDWTWYPQGEGIAVLRKARQVERQLDTRVSLRYVQSGLSEALMDLARRADVLMRFDPGVLASLPSHASERFSLSIENATVKQVLEVIAGETGLAFAIESDGVRVTNARSGGASSVAGSTGTLSSQAETQAAAAAAAAALRTNPIIGQINFPLPGGASFAFFVRQNDLPPEVEIQRQNKVNATINQIRRQLHAEEQQD